MIQKFTKNDKINSGLLNYTSAIISNFERLYFLTQSSKTIYGEFFTYPKTHVRVSQQSHLFGKIKF